MRIRGKQIAAARELLGITQEELAEAAQVARPTIATFETGQTEPRPESIEKMRRELERRGVEFTNGDRGSAGDGIGVRISLAKAEEFARTSRATDRRRSGAT